MDSANPTFIFVALALTYLASAIAVGALTPRLLSDWDRSYGKRVTPSLLLRAHPSCPSHIYGYACLRPTNEDRIGLWLVAICPVLNTSVLLAYATVFPCVAAHRLILRKVFGSEAAYKRWLRSDADVS